MSLLTDDETTRADIAVALAYVNASAKRCPSHFMAEHAKWHEEINHLLTDWEKAPA